MNLQHINLKFFISNTDAIQLGTFSGVFNGWIQRQVTEDLLVDVADYLHVNAGPGILLIGHEANYSLDNQAGRLGLLYNRKARLDGTNVEKLVHAARAALKAAYLLETENGVRFDGRELQIIVNDRLIVPNTKDAFSALEPALREFAGKLFGGAEFSLVHHDADPRERFNVSVRAAAGPGVQGLLANVSAEPEHQHAQA